MKANRLIFTSWISILAIALAACGNGAGDAGPDAGIDAAVSCPAEPPSGDCAAPPLTLRCSYGADQGGPTECYCLSGSWQCTSCPGDFANPDATCTPGDTCGWLDWEHGCSCSCNDQGRWQCTPDTIGSVCPTGLPDAGP
ncbi:MAG TPA: hypothetical protein VNM90_00260 [Haliangium sp.]|nr:hypothetical protein [Haliangium sp.]